MFGQFVNITTCLNCGGEGIIIKDPCSGCGGEGRVHGESTIKVTVPPGVQEGNYIPLRGQGNAGRRNGPAGDILVVIEEEAHEFFKRNGDDIVYDLWISFPTAVVGGEVEIPTLSGKAKLVIDSGTPAGRMLRMKEQGIPHLNHYGRGDQLVRVNIWVPSKLNAKEKELLKNLQRENIFPRLKRNGAAANVRFSARSRMSFPETYAQTHSRLACFNKNGKKGYSLSDRNDTVRYGYQVLSKNVP